MDAPTIPLGSVGFEPEIDAKGLASSGLRRLWWTSSPLFARHARASALERGVVQDVAPLLRKRRVSRSVVRPCRVFRSALNALKVLEIPSCHTSSP